MYFFVSLSGRIKPRFTNIHYHIINDWTHLSYNPNISEAFFESHINIHKHDNRKRFTLKPLRRPVYHTKIDMYNTNTNMYKSYNKKRIGLKHESWAKKL